MKQLDPAPTSGADRSSRPACAAHRVHFYDRQSALVDCVVDFLRPALPDGVAIIVATAEHRSAFGAALAATGLDVGALTDRGHLVLVDASQALERFCVAGVPDPDAFAAVIGGLLDTGASSSAPVRVYGEMVTVLWEDGRVPAAMALEALWNDLAGTQEFELLCGYPSALFSRPGSDPVFQALCEEHTAVTLAPSQGADLLGPGNGRSRQIDDRAAQWHLPASLTSGSQVRHELRAVLVSWGLAELLDVAELLVSELVNNSVIHARSQVTVQMRHRGGALRVEVTDAGVGRLRPRDSDLEDTHGRGLMLVDAMSDVWGTAVSSEAKTVWFELHTDAAG